MNILLLIALVVTPPKSVEVRYTNQAPRIDGFIEDVWQQADSAYDFVQFAPYEKEKPSEKTSVYLLQDNDNLYVAFRCYAESLKPIACLTKDEDYVVFGIDPVMNKTMAYFFWVYGSEIMWDGWILDDGRSFDQSWEGVWYKGIRLYEDRMEVEFKIPFKSIRYKKGLNEWGIQFQRYIASKRETSYWTEVLQINRDMVSNWGTAVNINPQSTGYYFELYPEAYFRADRRWNPDASRDSINYKPSASLNLKWDITSQASLNATLYPDFAQIEADPYTLNLGRYPTYLNERRPFFIEGSEIFRMSTIGTDVFNPLRIFYSRNIGRSVNGDAIPIIGGLKLTSKSNDWNFGLLSAYTDQYTYNNSFTEPSKGYGVFKVNRKILETSDISAIGVGSFTNDSTYNYAVGFDGVFRQGPNQLIVQTAFSDRNRKQGFALTGGYRVMFDDFLTLFAAEMIQDSFDVSEIGYVPWAGRKRLLVSSGPYKTYRRGFVNNFRISPGLAVTQEPGSQEWSKGIGVDGNIEFRNFWGIYADANIGKSYEADTNFISRSFNANAHGRIMNNDLNFGCYYRYGVNYARGYLAYSGSHWMFYSYSISSTIRPAISANWTIEWDTLNKVIATTPILRPNIYFRFRAPIELTLLTELVMTTPGMNFNKTDLVRVRSGLLFAWNFAPKSWFYFVLNDSRSDDVNGKLLPRYQGGAVKVKYLFYF
ncbi:MAG: carbohydrate binding family 9 domain-containing protein [Candidatus Latescibacteria bacterium]|nr:carbohydrate binding family 9 domain-containing protein [Candidatus Latescibacterota bacterium]